MMYTQRSLTASRTQRGFSLVEMMIAMVIGLILIAGVIQIFVSSKQSYRVQDSMGRLQENARFAMDFLSREVRMAGFTGCFKNSPTTIENILNTPSAFSWDINNMLSGNEATSATTWSPALDASLTGLVKGGTDVINVRHMSSQGINLVPSYSDSAQLFISPSGNIFADGDILMVTDCTQGSVFQVTNLQPSGGKVNVVHSSAGGVSPGNTGPHLANSYGPGSEVAKLENTVFYIATGTSGEPALFERTLGNSAGTASASSQELVEGVEDMQILYGEDTDGDGSANVYVTADAVGNMANVVSVRISLLMRTADNNLVGTPQTYNYDGSSITATDKRIRRVFNSTIKLRNRGVL